LDSLLDHLNNRRTMHDSQNDALKWARENQNDGHYCSRAMFHGL
jgi:hypothetical protein